MHEINKLRQRLTNVGKNVTEYRMTVAEARVLLAEIDTICAKKTETVAVVAQAPVITSRIVDGGEF